MVSVLLFLRSPRRLTTTFCGLQFLPFLPSVLLWRFDLSEEWKKNRDKAVKCVDCHIRWWNWEFERAKVFQLLLNLENIIKYKKVTDVVRCMLSPYFLVCSWACAWNLQIIHAFPFLANYTYAFYGLWNLNLAQLMIWSASNTELFGDIFSCLIFHSPFSIKLDGFHSSIWS